MSSIVVLDTAGRAYTIRASEVPGGRSDGVPVTTVWEASPDVTNEAREAVPLAQTHASQALELAGLTRPGPFGPRTIELGDYFGIFDEKRLVAMAGERMNAGKLREISGVCTHPEFRGRGFARRLVAILIYRQRLTRRDIFSPSDE